MQLSTPLSGVLRTTKVHLAALESMGLATVHDLLLYLPRSHEDLSQLHTILSAPLGEKTTIRGTITNIKLVFTRTKKKLVTADLTDSEDNRASVVWYNQPHLKRMLAEGMEVALTGKLEEQGRKLVIQSPQVEIAGQRPLVHSGRLVPVYPQHDIISTRWLREKITLIKDAIDLLPESLPSDLIAEEKLMNKVDAVRALHFPDDAAAVNRAKERIAFEHMYLLQQEALMRRAEWRSGAQERLKTPMHVELIKGLFKSLHFQPTKSQRIAIYEILRDMEQEYPMSRLLEGDVGSGKTLVAIAVMGNVLASGGQCVLMVPTEVLARQHAEIVTKMLLNLHRHLVSAPVEGRASAPKDGCARNMLPPVVKLLTGSLPRSESDAIKRSAAAGTTSVVVGTHALIEDNVRFRDLRLVIVDEQHRFGVHQRRRLVEKGSPHFLAMTATPIPRTLALTAYGEHDLSVLIEKPGNRQKIHTKVVGPADRRTVELFMDKCIGEGRQIFVICPLIDESPSTTLRTGFELAEVKSVKQEVARLKESFPRRRIAMLHGKMTPEEKQTVMREFRERKSDILVATSVIEVGIDIPNATIMVIEGAERFGLAQLHQLRGRVGRGENRSHCFLFTTTPEQAKSVRLKAMEQHDSGFTLAEIDLKIRGPGELFGLRQSGIPDSPFQNLFSPELIVRARRAVERNMGIATERMV